METGLAGKGVLVTGGAGGIGSACVRAFAAEGARVVIHYRTSRDRAEELARETDGVALQADLTEEAEVERLFVESSTAGRFGEAGHADYAAAKSAIQVGLLLSLKNEIVRIAPGARVNAVAPGWTSSPMTSGELEDEFVDRLSRTMALRKVAQAEDIARAVVVLASDELSGHVTGELVTVAGGMEGRTVHELE